MLNCGQGLTDFDGKARRQLKCYEVTQLSEVRTAYSHEIDDRQDLFRKWERVVFTEPEVSFEALCFSCHFSWSTDIFAFQVMIYIKVLDSSYVERIALIAFINGVYAVALRSQWVLFDFDHP